MRVWISLSRGIRNNHRSLEFTNCEGRLGSPKTVSLPENSKNIKGIRLLTCLSLVTATMVGTGVYTSLGFQLLDLQSGFSILCLWALGGVISLCGALSYAELAARIPRSGGEYTYLSEIYHPALGFMAACVSLFAGFAAPISLSAMAFGTYLHAAIPMCPIRLSSVAAVVLLSCFHLRSLLVSSLIQNGVTALKFLLVGIFIVIGIWSASMHPKSLGMLFPTAGSFDELLKPSSGIALLFVLYSYSGWNAVTYIAGEVRDRQRTVGLALMLGTIAVMLFYMLLNAVFLTAAPAAEMRGIMNVGSIAATHLIGALGGRIMSGIIGLGLLASISAMIWTGPRVTQRVGEDYPALALLAPVTREGIPRRAILLQLSLVLVLLAMGSFETVLVFAQMPLLLCLILGVIGLIVMRCKSQGSGVADRNPPLFRCPFYPLPPLLFILCSLAGLFYSALNKPWIALSGLGIMIVPLLLHPWISRRLPMHP
jgi:basic amino acid/polyamine antiporter, APA family